jgi:hypothetical protein
MRYFGNHQGAAVILNCELLRSKNMKHLLSICLTAAVLVLAAGCASDQSSDVPTKPENAVQKVVLGQPQVEVISGHKESRPLPKPEVILVYDFLVPDNVVTTDQSVAARIHARRTTLLDTLQGSHEPKTPAQQVQSSFADTLIKELQKTSLPVRHMTNALFEVVPPNALVVQGEFTQINEGNRSKRIMIGFGRGASDVEAHTTVSLTTEKQPIVLSEFNLQSPSGNKPGAVVGMGAGSAAAGAAAGAGTSVAVGSAGQESATVESDAERMAREVARQIEQRMASQNWISTAAR